MFVLLMRNGSARHVDAFAGSQYRGHDSIVADKFGESRRRGCYLDVNTGVIEYSGFAAAS